MTGLRDASFRAEVSLMSVALCDNGKATLMVLLSNLSDYLTGSKRFLRSVK